MTKINLGVSGKKNVNIDLDVLIPTRLLIQANSGGGKSYLIRRLVEQAFDKIQIIILDPEGEFSTLREKFAFVLVGKGGETPADTRSAALVAHKLLKLKASAVCDLYELKARDRHEWVKLFLEALVNAPKNLWHPVLVIVDEAHVFCPEKGHGESVASDAMVDLITKGRKRGFCGVLATQRLGKLRKDASAELLNRLIGPTFEDIDCKRAVDLFSVPGEEAREFMKGLKVLDPGNFWGLGRAISKERILVQIGGVETSHPQPGSSVHSYEPPPPPEKIKSLLPQLSDLPQEAEKKIKTEKELRDENASLRRQLAARPEVQPDVQRVEVPILSDDQIDGLRELADDARATANNYRESLKLVQGEADAFEKAANEITATINSFVKRPAPVMPHPRKATSVLAYAPARTNGNGDNGADLKGAEQRILDALAELEVLRVSQPERVQVAFLAGYSNLNSKGFVNAIGALRTSGLIDYPRQGTVSLTDEGRGHARYPDAPASSEDIQDRIISLLGGASARILRPLIEGYPQSIDREEVGRLAGYSNVNSKGFVNAVGRLRSLGFVDYPESGRVAAQPILFLEG